MNKGAIHIMIEDALEEMGVEPTTENITIIMELIGDVWQWVGTIAPTRKS